MTFIQYNIVKQQIEARISLTKTYKFFISAYLDIKVMQKDIYNAQEQIKHQKLKRQTQIKALLYNLEDAKYKKGNNK
jgi:hypothetical protein